jgi:putative ABC transport system substrate-binding protein
MCYASLSKDADPANGECMRRRNFVAALGASVSAWPIRALAQAGLSLSMPVVGFLNSASPVTYRFNADAFREGLAQAGFVEGRNVRIEERWANADYNALPALAAELVAKGVVAIAATGDIASARAARVASATIPIVFTIGGDPVRFGLVESLARPGGNLTGIAFVPNQLGAKRVQLLHEVAPLAGRIGALMNPDNVTAGVEEADIREGAAKLGLQLVVQNARNGSQIDLAFGELARARVDALIAASDPVMLDRRQQVAAHAERHKLPAISFTRQFAMAGLLMSYGPDIGWMYRQAGGYVGRILKGAKPADIPVMQSVRFELVLNIKTAKHLGLTISPTFLSSVDEVIE